jgi:hypothetical protein
VENHLSIRIDSDRWHRVNDKIDKEGNPICHDKRCHNILIDKSNKLFFKSIHHFLNWIDQ